MARRVGALRVHLPGEQQRRTRWPHSRRGWRGASLSSRQFTGQGMKSFIVGATLLCGSLCVVTVPVAAQQNLQTQEIAKKPGKPAPRLADGRIDLGNGK